MSVVVLSHVIAFWRCQENEAPRRKLADISDENDENPGTGTTHGSKRKRPATLHPQDLTTKLRMIPACTGQLEDAFVGNMGHRFCMPWVYEGVDIPKTKFDDTYDATERFMDDNKFQGKLQAIVGLLKDQLSQETILSQKWVCREVREFLSSD